jgi:hypothetical protein
MAASTLLTTLPVDAKQALATDGKVTVEKGKLHIYAHPTALHVSYQGTPMLFYHASPHTHSRNLLSQTNKAAGRCAAG